MTKTLTEQWKDLELPEGLYYFKTRYNNIFIGYPRERNMFRAIDDGLFDESDKIEVLAPVPSYDEFVQQRDFVKDHLKVLIENMNLKRKLEIATKALQYYADGTLGSSVARQALKEMEGVK